MYSGGACRPWRTVALLDLLLAFSHHLLAFALLGFIVAELVLLRAPMSAGTPSLLGRVDAGFGLVSITPTARIVRWGRRARQDGAALPSASESAAVRRLVGIELALFVLLPLLAAAMARGYGEWLR